MVDAILKLRGQIGGVNDLDHAAQFPSGHETQFYPANWSEKSVTADGSAEELRIFLARTVYGNAISIDERERFNIGNKRFHGQPASMNIR